MELIQTIVDLTNIPSGTLLMAKPEGEDWYKVHSSLEHLNGTLVHISRFRVIGTVTTQEQSIIEGIKNIYRKWSNEPPSDNHDAELTDLATRIYNYVKEELERNHNAARSG